MTTNTRSGALRDALDCWRAANENWVDAAMALAEQLKEARAECGGDDTAFGQWLRQNGCGDLSSDTRAAFVRLGEHPAVARRVLESTTRRSIRHIWQHEVRPRVEPLFGLRASTAPQSADLPTSVLPSLATRPDLSPGGDRAPPAPPAWIVVTEGERAAAQAAAQRHQAAQAAAFLSERARFAAHDERYDVLLAAWHACSSEQQIRFRAFLGLLSAT